MDCAIMATTTQLTRRRHVSTPSTHRTPRGRKFMQTLSREAYKTLEREAQRRGVTLQELLRAQIIPDWLRANAEETR